MTQTVTISDFQYTYMLGLSKKLRDVLEHTYKIEKFDIEDVFTDTQLSKAEFRKGYVYVVLQFPEYNTERQNFDEKEVHCFIDKNRFLMINKHEYKHAEQFHMFRETLFTTNTSFALFNEMLDYFVKNAFRAVSKFKIELDELEHKVFDTEQDDDFSQDVSILMRNMINFSALITPLKLTVEDLLVKKGGVYQPTQQNMEQLDDTLDKIKKIINNIHTLKERINLVRETNEALIARSTNEIIKALTSWSIILLLPALVSGILGMNVYFGWNPDTDIISTITAAILIVGVTVSAYIYFKKKRWLS